MGILRKCIERDYKTIEPKLFAPEVPVIEGQKVLCHLNETQKKMYAAFEKRRLILEAADAASGNVAPDDEDAFIGKHARIHHELIVINSEMWYEIIETLPKKLRAQAWALLESDMLAVKAGWAVVVEEPPADEFDADEDEGATVIEFEKAKRKLDS